MADYWRRTGTRPSATVKFIPWDGEETGTLGSLDYANNNVVPGQEGKVRGYWNTDPCAGGYPSYVAGNGTRRLTMGIQLGDVTDIDPDISTDTARVDRFNERAPQLVEQILDKIDDTVPTVAGDVETFISANEGTSDLGSDHLNIGFAQPVLFSSDWRNFIRLGVPFFNPGPEVTGPNQGSDGSVDIGGPPLALVGFHSPLDNIQTMMTFTGPPPAGATITNSYAKGMEFCANMLAWGMLQHDQGGTQTATTDPVAYFEALPNEAPRHAPVKFDASGSYQYADVATRKLVGDDDLEYRWNFGDGSPTSYGMVLPHAYSRPGVFKATLTVENIRSGKADSMTIPITVEPSDLAPGEANPVGTPKPRPGSGPGSGPTACASGFVSVRAKPAGKGIGFEWQRVGDSIVKIDVRRATAKGSKSVRRFSVSENFTWDGALKRGALKRGVYEARVSTLGEVRRFTFLRGKGGKFKRIKRVAIKPTCAGVVRSFEASAPAFRTSLKATYRIGEDARVVLRVLRGKKTVLTTKGRTVQGGRTVTVKVNKVRTLRRGTYRFVLRATAGGQTIQRSVWARKL
jgi:PKD repeat protein